MIAAVRAALLRQPTISRPLYRLTALLKRKVMREAYWIGFGEVATALGGLIAVRLITEILDPQQYGLLTLTIGIVTLALGFAVNPFLQVAMRLRSEYAASDLRASILRRESLQVIRWFVLLACVLMVIGGTMFGAKAGAPDWIGVLMAAMLLVDSVRSYEIAMLNAARRQKAMSSWQAVEAWGRPLLAVLLVWALGADTVSVLVGYVIASLVTTVVFASWIPLEGKGAHSEGPSLGADSVHSARVLRGQIWRLVIPLLPVALLSWVTSLSDRYIIAGMLSLQDAGLYAAAYALVSRPFLMSGAFLDTWLRPRLYESVSSGRADAIRRVVVSWAAVSLGTGAGGVVGFALLHAWVAELLLAAPYRAAAHLMPWIALGYALAIAAQLPTRICYACNRTDYVLVVQISSAVSAVIVTIPGVALLGLYGAALAVPIYFGTQLVVASVLAIRSVKSGVSRS